MIAHLDEIAYALGDVPAVVDQSEANGLLFSTAADLSAAGFKQHHRSAPDTSAYDLGRRAVLDLEDRGAIDGVDAIVYATCLTLNGNLGPTTAFEATGDVKHLMDYPASRLQAEVGLDDAVVIGLNQQACTSMLGSLRIADALLASEPTWDRILCVSADRFPTGAIYEQAYNLISDGAAACTVTRSPGRYRLVASHHITNGALGRATDDETVGTYFSYTNRVVTECLAKVGLTTADLGWVVPQNTNVHAWHILARVWGVDPGQVWFPTLSDIGHVISSDNIVNLASLEASGQLRPGDRLVLVMAGFGLNWQCVVLEATEAVVR